MINDDVDAKLGKQDFTPLYLDTTQETLRMLYAQRDPKTGEMIEDLNDIIYRVSLSVALAEIKYHESPIDIVKMTVEEAISRADVLNQAQAFAYAIGNQQFWPNTPASINADPEIAFKVIQYWAYGQLAGMEESQIWSLSEERRSNFLQQNAIYHAYPEYVQHMGRLAAEVHGKGCLAACGVAFITDSLEAIQEAARIETLATKAAMGMGLNTSSLRPWSTIVANGAAASGPDRFYEKTISKAVDAVAQGGRRGGALIELRNSDHPDILTFIDKKKLPDPPSLSKIFAGTKKYNQQYFDENKRQYKSRMLKWATEEFGRAVHKYESQQVYLKNTNITVLAMPGFMQAVENKQWYQCRVKGQAPWTGNVYDPRRQMFEKNGKPVINKLTKEFVYEEYYADLEKYPEALASANPDESFTIVKEDKVIGVAVRGSLYAPDVFDRIVENMQDSGEPGFAFYDLVNETNANSHIYDLDTCNPCGEQFLPAGLGKDGKTTFMGNCNLSSLNAAHEVFMAHNDYDWAKLKDVVTLQQRFMDNVTDVSWYPIPQQNMTARLERRNGGGFAGIAEAISRKGLRFGSEASNIFVERLFMHYTEFSVIASVALAKERGTYPLWEGSMFQAKGIAIRNSCLVNNAPTGTLAQAMQTSWGVDPHNGIVFSRIVRGRSIDFLAPGFEAMMRKHGAWPKLDSLYEKNVADLMARIRANNKSVQGLSFEHVPEAVQHAFPIRVEITPDEYIRHLAACYAGARLSNSPESFNSISNTCSIPLRYPAKEIADSIHKAYKMGVKALTFYPDGSRLSQPVEQIAAEGYEVSADLLDQLEVSDRRQINIDRTIGTTYKVKVGCPDGICTLHVTLNHEADRPGELVEIYARMAKSGAIEAGLFEAVGRIASSFLQFAASLGEAERQKAEDLVVKQLVNIQSSYPMFFRFEDTDEKPQVVQSPCDGLAKAIIRYRKFYNEGGAQQDDTPKISLPVSEQLTTDMAHALRRACTKCGGTTTKLDGCTVCEDCGTSKCG